MIRKILISGLIIIVFSCINDSSDIDSNEPVLRELSFNEESVLHTSNQFTFDLFQEINSREQENNFFFSPLSVEYALGMTMNGADGQTLEDIRSTMHSKELSEEDINAAMNSLTDFLLHVDKTVLIKIANSVWYRKDLTIKEAFKKSIETYYSGKAEALNFSDPNAKNTINKWVADKTENLISELIDAIPADAVMYLINAVYYKAEWQYQFDKSQTESQPFYIEDGNQTQTEMMFSKGAKINYYKDDDLQMIDLPYGNGQFSMTILLPEPDRKISDITENLTEEKFNSLISVSNSVTPRIRMPKFRIEYKTLLNDPLIDLGMGIAFSESADFSRLFNETLPLTISRVIHKAVIEVNEEGSEAAAATAVEISLTSASPTEPLTILIDRPFVFFIREKYSGTILFAGKLMNPE